MPPLELTSPQVVSTYAPRPCGFAGEVVYIYAFDVAYEMDRKPIVELLGQPVVQFQVDASKRNPRQLFFYRAQTVRLPALERVGPRGPMRLERSIKLLPVGAISITVRTAFAVDRLEDLVAYHDLRFADGAHLYDEVVQLAQEVQKELLPILLRPKSRLGNEEAYTVFCVKSPPGLPSDSPSGQAFKAEEWLAGQRRAIAAILTEEEETSQLSEQEVLDSTGKYVSYYEHDLAVMDWDAALVLDHPAHFDETLYLMELANLQLAELEAYDNLLDDAIESAYRDLARRHPISGYNTSMRRSLRELRIDMARLSDELSNITKFFGDWHLARVYKAISERFHLGDWHHAIDEKLKTLDDMYQLLQSDRNERMILTLEIIMTLLFVIDVVMLFVMGYR